MYREGEGPQCLLNPPALPASAQEDQYDTTEELRRSSIKNEFGDPETQQCWVRILRNMNSVGSLVWHIFMAQVRRSKLYDMP